MLSNDQLALLRYLSRVYWIERSLSKERLFRKIERRLLPVDRAIFADSLDYYREFHGIEMSWSDALGRARDKAMHKSAWFERPRESLSEIRSFYREVHVYPFRQPVNWRYAATDWMLRMVSHLPILQNRAFG